PAHFVKIPDHSGHRRVVVVVFIRRQSEDDEIAAGEGSQPVILASAQQLFEIEKFSFEKQGRGLVELADQDSRVGRRNDGVSLRRQRATVPVTYPPLEDLARRVQGFGRLDAFLQIDAVFAKELLIAGNYAAERQVVVDETQQAGDARAKHEAVERRRVFANFGIEPAHQRVAEKSLIADAPGATVNILVWDRER